MPSVVYYAAFTADKPFAFKSRLTESGSFDFCMDEAIPLALWLRFSITTINISSNYFLPVESAQSAREKKLV
jgi:hypothetical protein